MFEGHHNRPLRLAIFNVKYSPNLGDGILCECLEAEIRRAADGVVVVSLDLAGRRDYTAGGTFRSTAMWVLERSPTFLRHLIVTTVLGWVLKFRMRPYWKEVLHDIDAVVVGGGNLFGDADLNFPLKLDAALAEARLADRPVAVFGVGVSDNWSPRGETLFSRSLLGIRLVYAGVRERRSSLIWNKHLVSKGIRPALVGYDPGLLVVDHQPRRTPRDEGPPVVGIGITHPMVLRYHSTGRFDETTLTQWLSDLIGCCLRRGWRVILFTNGSPEDEEYLRRISSAVIKPELGDKVTTMPRFRHPMDLALFISGLDLLMAHRLHANCTAYSYAVPHIGFAWDEKLESFFSMIGRAEFVCQACIDRPEAVAELGDTAMVQGIDKVRHTELLTACRDDVHDLVTALQTAVTEGRGAQRLSTASSET